MFRALGEIKSFTKWMALQKTEVYLGESTECMAQYIHVCRAI